MAQTDDRGSRAARSRVRSERRRRTSLAVGISVVALLVLVGAAAASRLAWRTATAAPSQNAPLAATAVTSTASSTPAAGQVEVPALLGVSLTEAKALIGAAGLELHVTTEGSAVPAAQSTVKSQLPAAGVIVAPRTRVAVKMPPMLAAKGTAGRKGSGFTVVIDPGHQSRANLQAEPIGPGATQTYPKMTSGGAGVATLIPESELNLQIATNLADKLRSAGVKVVLTRTTNDVDLSEVQRAKIANDAHADLMIKVHADSSKNAKDSGVSAVYPSPNEWTRSIVTRSKAAALSIERKLIAATGALDHGSSAGGSVPGFAYSAVPVVLVEVGFQSNRVEDRLLASPRYQDLIGDGIATGVLAYLNGGGR